MLQIVASTMFEMKKCLIIWELNKWVNPNSTSRVIIPSPPQIAALQAPTGGSQQKMMNSWVFGRGRSHASGNRMTLSNHLYFIGIASSERR